MTDLIARLRELADQVDDEGGVAYTIEQGLPSGTMRKAADELERLTALASERAKQAEPVAIVDLSGPEPRLAQLAYSLTHGQELYAAPPADDEAVRLLMKAKRAHRYFDTGGDVTSCPAADDLGPCDCGADAFNAEIDAYLAKFKA